MAGQKSSKEELQKLFKEFDADGSGFLSLEEVKKILEKANKHVTQTQIDEVFTFFDSGSGSGDKKISFDEFCNGLQKLEEFVEDCKRLFSEHDKDKSGFLDQKELEKVLQECKFNFTDAEIKEIFKSADPNGDNKISCEEFVNAFS